MATQTLSLLSTVMDVIVSRPEANTPTLYPAGTLILLGSGLTGTRLAHFPAGPAGSAVAVSWPNADPDTDPTANASIAAYVGILIFLSSTVELLPLKFHFNLPYCSQTNHIGSFVLPSDRGQCDDATGSVRDQNVRI